MENGENEHGDVVLCAPAFPREVLPDEMVRGRRAVPEALCQGSLMAGIRLPFGDHTAPMSTC
ncbi:hypothetical protein KDAU_00290 [Dictyobacter aurantiacus]|uniref:Uncharacterized protein n=1 Tax=Dictyobacter aurantiacus TaxID=1936993 RepID=A0A401Z753_9CHLR|nr:hypothetical protein KDAU_00290 [Dictyobacter aurantiacus]